jgi:tRNA U34 5-carboxymethylaminomethyl modifying GTPase MnmE/TrmE
MNSKYFRKNKLILNVKKSSFILIRTEKSDLVIKYDDKSIEQWKEIKILSITFDNKLGFTTLLNQISSKVSKIVGTVSRVRYFLLVTYEFKFPLNGIFNSCESLF